MHACTILHRHTTHPKLLTLFTVLLLYWFELCQNISTFSTQIQGEFGMFHTYIKLSPLITHCSFFKPLTPWKQDSHQPYYIQLVLKSKLLVYFILSFQHTLKLCLIVITLFQTTVKLHLFINLSKHHLGDYCGFIVVEALFD